MSAWRGQNNAHPKGRVPGYYANNHLYPNSYAPTESQTRVSRRIHDGFALNRNYGLDTVSDDVNSSIYSSPYYINGRYNSDNLTTQRANSASVQGTEKLLIPDEYVEKDELELTQTPEATIEMWQGKQIKFWIPYDGKVVGNEIILKNTGGCTGILSIYISAKPDSAPLYETAVDLCKVSQDKFEKFTLYSMTVVPAIANPKGRLYVRMEIWDEISEERSDNPFNTGRKIEIAATGLGNHEACVYKLQSKNEMVKETYDYQPYPNRPLIGLITSEWESVPVNRLDEMNTGGYFTYAGIRYDVFCIKNESEAKVLIYSHALKEFVDNGIKVDSRIEALNIAQVSVTDPELPKLTTTMLYYVDGYSPLQFLQIGKWDYPVTLPSTSGEAMSATVDESTWFNSRLGEYSGLYTFEYSGANWTYNGEVVTLSDFGVTVHGGTPSINSTINVYTTVTLGGTKTIETVEFVDARPVIGASLIMFHNNRLYLSGFRSDPNLVQCSAIDETGPRFNLFPYRFYTPNRNPYDTSLNPITAMVEYASDQIMFVGKNFFSIFRTYSSKSGTMENGMPTQVSTFIESAGVQSQGDICNYKGVIYSYDQKEGIRRFAGAVWNRLPTTIDSHYDRVDMNKPRHMWGYANKLYYNYYDSIDGKAKCFIWDMDMNYQQYPWFQDVDIPFCDVRWDETEDLIGIHPDYPMVMKLYAEDCWRRLDTPITFRRDTKFISMPGNAQDFTVSRFHAKVINNSNRWWYVSLMSDKQNMTQFRGHDSWYRQPVWDTITVKEPVESPFPFEDTFEENAIYRISIMDIRIRASAVQARIMAKTFRNQANLVSAEFEVSPKNYL